MKPRRTRNPDRIRRPEGNGGREGRYRTPEAVQREDRGRDEGADGTVEAGRRRDARHLAHEEAPIEAAGLHQKALPDVGMPSQIHAVDARGIVETGVRALQPTAALTEQALFSGTGNWTPVAIHTGARRRLALPAASAAFRFPPAARLRPARAPSPTSQPSSSCRRHWRPVRSGRRPRPSPGPRRARPCEPGGYSRPYVRDLRVPILRVGPVVVGTLLRPFRSSRANSAVSALRCPTRRPVGAGTCRSFIGVAPGDAPQRRIRFQRRRIDADRLALDETGVGQTLGSDVETA